MKADLHFHSKYSDGTLWPSEMVKLGKEKGLDLIALTDHDTFSGVPEFLKECEENGIKGIAGIEIDFIDSKWDFKSEVLGYFPNGNYKNTKAFIDYYGSIRKQIAEKSIEIAKNEYNVSDLNFEDFILNKVGIVLTKEKVNQISITKPDLFSYFQKRVPDFKFKKEEYKLFKSEFFKHPDLKNIANSKPDLIKCIQTIKSDGGFPVLAHLGYQFGKNPDEFNKEYDSYLMNLKEAKSMGLWGIELHAYDTDEEALLINEIVVKLAQESGLRLTTGSDSHGPNHEKKNREIGDQKGKFLGFK